MDDCDCPEAESGEVAVACPPADSLVEIFSRLHAKPLFRFKCVSKDWCSLIADRLRCRKLPFPQTLEGFFAAAGGGEENYGDFIDLSGRPVPLVDPSFSFLTKSPEIEKIVLLQSCNGLVLFGHMRVLSEGRYDLLGYIVCNPATEEWVSVPSSGYTPEARAGIYGDDEDDSDVYLIFDPAISPHFQLIELRLQRMEPNVVVHTFFSETGSWRLEEAPGLQSKLGLGRVDLFSEFAGCPFNGVLHVRVHQNLHPKENRNRILVVGGEGRPFRTLYWPEKDRGFLVFIGHSQGRLHCFSGCTREVSLMTELSIWVLEDYNGDKWVLRDCLSLSQLFGRMCGCFINDWNVVGIHLDRGLVFFAEYWNHMLISYDMDKKEVCAICSLHGYWQPIPYVPYFAESGVSCGAGTTAKGPGSRRLTARPATKQAPKVLKCERAKLV